MRHVFLNLIEDLFTDPRIDPLVRALEEATHEPKVAKLSPRPQGEDYFDKVVIPGYSKEQIEITHSNGILTGVAKTTDNDKRSFQLSMPEDIWDISTIECKLENGVLAIRAKRLKEKQKRKISIT